MTTIHPAAGASAATLHAYASASSQTPAKRPAGAPLAGRVSHAAAPGTRFGFARPEFQRNASRDQDPPRIGEAWVTRVHFTSAMPQAGERAAAPPVSLKEDLRRVIVQETETQLLHAFCDRLTAEVSSPHPSMETMEELVRNLPFLDLSNAVRHTIQEWISERHAAHGLDRYRSFDEAVAHFQAELDCAELQVPFEEAVAEYRSRDWTDAVRSQLGESDRPALTLPEFVDGCIGAVFAPELARLEQRIPAEHERMRQRHGAAAADADTDARVAALQTFREQRRLPSLFGDDRPEQQCASLFGGGIVVNAMTARIDAFRIPEKLMPEMFEQHGAFALPTLYRLRFLIYAQPSAPAKAVDHRTTVKSNAFVTQRRLASQLTVEPPRPGFTNGIGWLTGVFDLHGPSLLEGIENLRPHQTMIDIGTGCMAFPGSLIAPTARERELLAAGPLSRRIVGVAKVKSETVDADPVLRIGQQTGRLEFKEGELWQPGFPFERDLGIGQYALAVATFAFQYGPLPDTVFSAGLLLEPGGRLHFHHFFEAGTMLDENSRALSMEEFFERYVQGLRLVPTLICTEPRLYGTWMFRHSTAFIAERTEDPLRVARLDTHIQPAIPPDTMPRFAYRAHQGMPWHEHG